MPTKVGIHSSTWWIPVSTGMTVVPQPTISGEMEISPLILSLSKDGIPSKKMVRQAYHERVVLDFKIALELVKLSLFTPAGALYRPWQPAGATPLPVSLPARHGPASLSFGNAPGPAGTTRSGTGPKISFFLLHPRQRLSIHYLSSLALNLA